MAFPIFCEKRLSLVVGCDYRDYRYFFVKAIITFCKKISRNKRGRFTCAAIQRTVEGTEAVEETEGHRGDRGL